MPNHYWGFYSRKNSLWSYFLNLNCLIVIWSINLLFIALGKALSKLLHQRADQGYSTTFNKGPCLIFLSVFLQFHYFLFKIKVKSKIKSLSCSIVDFSRNLRKCLLKCLNLIELQIQHWIRIAICQLGSCGIDCEM